MTLIIGLAGEAGAGKSTVAAHLVEKYGAKRYSFAEPLKRIAIAALDFTEAQCFGTQAEKEAIDPRYGFSPRTFLQRLGTQGIREHLGADIWLRTCLERIFKEEPDLAVIEDVRFVNEARAVREVNWESVWHKGQVWLVENPTRETLADDQHASEAGVRLIREQRLANLAIEPKKRGVAELLGLVDGCAEAIGLAVRS